MVAVPDERLDKLAEMYHPKKKTPAVIEFVDIAGLVKGASQGAGLGNKFLENIRRTDAIVHFVRCFDAVSYTHRDVYKRQVLYHACQAAKNFGSTMPHPPPAYGIQRQAR